MTERRIVVSNTPEGAQILALFEAEVERVHDLLDHAGMPRDHEGQLLSMSQRVEHLVWMASAMADLIDEYELVDFLPGPVLMASTRWQ